FLIVVALSGITQFVRVIPLPKSAEVLQERSREIARRLGYAEAPRDFTYGFDYDPGGLGHLMQLDGSGRRWAGLTPEVPGVVHFWYREAQDYLRPDNLLARSPMANDPPPLISGMLAMDLDTEGRLLRFEAVPPQRDEQPVSDPAAPPRTVQDLHL